MNLDPNPGFSRAQLLQRDGPPMMVAVPPPPGFTQNFIDPPVSGADAPIFVGIGVTIAGLLVIVRMYTKGYLLRKFGPEDGTHSRAFLWKGTRGVSTDSCH